MSLKEALSRGLVLNDDDLFTLSPESRRYFARFEASLHSDDSNERGRALESLARSLLADIKSFTPIKDIDTYTNQIDVFVEARPLLRQHNFLSKLGSCFVCECKNEKTSVSVRDVQNFAVLIKQKSDTNLGILFSCNPLSGSKSDNAKLAQREFVLTEKLYILSVDYSDLKRVVNKGYNFLTMLHEKYRELYLDARRPLSFKEQRQLTSEEIKELQQSLARQSPRSPQRVIDY